jgi:hypothetical protein
MHEIRIIEESVYIQELRGNAEACRRAAATHAANFLGTGTSLCRDLRIKAECYDLIADTIEIGSLPLSPDGFIIPKP